MIDKEFILAQFAFEFETKNLELIKRLSVYEKQGHLKILNQEPVSAETLFSGEAYIIDVKIESVFATLLKLKDKELSERMRVSYISNELKDKYRK